MSFADETLVKGAFLTKRFLNESSSVQFETILNFLFT